MNQWSNKSFVLEAVSNNPYSLEFASMPLRGDKEICLTAFKKSGSTLRFANQKIQDSFEFVLAAVTNDGLSLAFASEFIKNNPTIISWAVQENGMALRYVPQKHRQNKKIILKALSNNGYAAEFVPHFLKYDFTVALTAVRQYGLALSFFPQEIRENPIIAEESLKSCASSFRFIGGNLVRNLGLVSQAVKSCGLNLYFVSPPYNSYKRIIFSALEQDIRYWKFAGELFRSDRSTNLALLKKYPNLTRHYPRSLNHDMKTFKPFLFCCKLNPKRTHILPQEIVKHVQAYLYFSPQFPEALKSLETILSKKEEEAPVKNKT